MSEPLPAVDANRPISRQIFGSELETSKARQDVGRYPDQDALKGVRESR